MHMISHKVQNLEKGSGLHPELRTRAEKVQTAKTYQVILSVPQGLRGVWAGHFSAECLFNVGLQTPGSLC